MRKNLYLLRKRDALLRKLFSLRFYIIRDSNYKVEPARKFDIHICITIPEALRLAIFYVVLFLRRRYNDIIKQYRI